MIRNFGVDYSMNQDSQFMKLLELLMELERENMDGWVGRWGGSGRNCQREKNMNKICCMRKISLKLILKFH